MALVHNTLDVDLLYKENSGKERTALNCASCHLNLRAMRALLHFGAHVGSSFAYEPHPSAADDQNSEPGNWKGSTPLQDMLEQSFWYNVTRTFLALNAFYKR